jgi:FAD:protein FMN transferase
MIELSRCQAWLGTYVSLQLRSDILDRSDLLALSSIAFAAIGNVHRSMSYQSVTSELSEVNRIGAGAWMQISSAMLTVIDRALDISAASGGVFDIAFANTNVAVKGIGDWRDIELDRNNNRIRLHAPITLDLSGIAKGFAVDQAAHTLSAHCDYTINAGGDLKISDWQHRHAHLRFVNTANEIEFAMQRASLASSSDAYQRATFDHAKKRLADSSDASYSVFADSCMVADALTKVLRLHADPRKVLQDFDAVGDIRNTLTDERVAQRRLCV